MIVFLVVLFIVIALIIVAFNRYINTFDSVVTRETKTSGTVIAEKTYNNGEFKSFLIGKEITKSPDITKLNVEEYVDKREKEKIYPFAIHSIFPRKEFPSNYFYQPGVKANVISTQSLDCPLTIVDQEKASIPSTHIVISKRQRCVSNIILPTSIYSHTGELIKIKGVKILNAKKVKASLIFRSQPNLIASEIDKLDVYSGMYPIVILELEEPKSIAFVNYNLPIGLYHLSKTGDTRIKKIFMTELLGTKVSLLNKSRFGYAEIQTNTIMNTNIYRTDNKLVLSLFFRYIHSFYKNTISVFPSSKGISIIKDTLDVLNEGTNKGNAHQITGKFGTFLLNGDDVEINIIKTVGETKKTLTYKIDNKEKKYSRIVIIDKDAFDKGAIAKYFVCSYIAPFDKSLHKPLSTTTSVPKLTNVQENNTFYVDNTSNMYNHGFVFMDVENVFNTDMLKGHELLENRYENKLFKYNSSKTLYFSILDQTCAELFSIPIRHDDSFTFILV